ncbi:hypothetical protein D6817_01070 [Candidatus Pacearchaeota archaeon]|nr:MAG: hypothetical protein D6817_01070 [Candidatus Pacearchaeota archaeon]
MSRTKDPTSVQNLPFLEEDIVIPAVVDFLIEDFKDTSSHLKETDKKIEFLFQLYGGTATFLVSIIVGLTSAALGSSRENAAIIIRIAPHISLALIIVVFGISWWLFEYMLRGLMMKTLYINRMNFLRREIYKRIGETVDKRAVFLYVGKVLPDNTIKKVGMGEMFVLALRWLIILLWFAFSVLLLAVLHLKVMAEWLVGFVCVCILTALWFLTKQRWREFQIETRVKVEKSWEER